MNRESGFQLRANPVQQGIVYSRFRTYEMSSERGLGGAHSPDMQIMDLADAWECREIVKDRLSVDARRDRLQREIERLSHQRPGPRYDDGANHKAYYRVEPRPLRKQDQPAGHDDAQRDEGVGGHVQEGAADVHVALSAGHEHHGGDGVDGDAACRDGHHGDPLGRLGMQQSQDRRPCDAAGDQQQQDGVAERRQDGGAAQAVRVSVGGCAPGQRGGQPGDAEAQHITEVVPGVGDQSQRVGCKTPDDLCNDIGRVEADADGKGPPKGGGGVVMMAEAPMPMPMRVRVFMSMVMRILRDMGVVMVIAIFVMMIVFVTVRVAHNLRSVSDTGGPSIAQHTLGQTGKPKS